MIINPGDRVTVELEVVSTDGDTLRCKWPRTGNLINIYRSSATSVVPKPWQPEVGDLMKLKCSQYVTHYEYRGTVDGYLVVKLFGLQQPNLTNLPLSDFEPLNKDKAR